MGGHRPGFSTSTLAFQTAIALTPGSVLCAKRSRSLRLNLVGMLGV
jgi:hypothetical protein